MPRIRRQFSGEALLREILAAPIVLTVMAGDRTTKSEVEILIATVRRRLASAQAALREGSPSGDMIAGDG